MYNNIYNTYAEEAIISNTSTGANSIPAANVVNSSPEPSGYYTSAQDYETPVSNIGLQRHYEPDDYAIPIDCQVPKKTDHVYAVLEKPNK